MVECLACRRRWIERKSAGRTEGQHKIWLMNVHGHRKDFSSGSQWRVVPQGGQRDLSRGQQLWNFILPTWNWEMNFFLLKAAHFKRQGPFRRPQRQCRQRHEQLQHDSVNKKENVSSLMWWRLNCTRHLWEMRLKAFFKGPPHKKTAYLILFLF